MVEEPGGVLSQYEYPVVYAKSDVSFRLVVIGEVVFGKKKKAKIPRTAIAINIAITTIFLRMVRSPFFSFMPSESYSA